MLEAAAPDFATVVVFHSLSKRSNLPGMRVGFAAGDRRFLDPDLELRNVAAPQVPTPAQYVAIAAYQDEAHVKENRKLYSEKFDLADQSSAAATATNARPEVFSCGSMCRSRAAVRSRQKGCGPKQAFAWSRDVILRASKPTAAILARTISASPWCKTRRLRRRHCIASSPCWDKDVKACGQQIAASTSSPSSRSIFARSSGAD